MEDKENIFIKKLKEESIIEFENYIPIIESEKKIKEAFYYFLYNDLIQVEINNINNIDIDNIINDPTIIIDQYLENVYSKISNSENNLLSELKKELTKKIIIIKNKINECNNHIEIIKKEYINISLQKYLPINNTKNLFSFENKTVLCLFKKNEYNIILGEFFAKIIFCSIEKKILNNNSINILDLYNNFYINQKIDSYIKTDGNIKDFKDIEINFKYWIILLFLIGQIFSNKSKYYLIFNIDEFFKHIELILHPKKEGKKTGKKTDKKKKKTKGGGNSKKIAFNKIIHNRKKKVNKPQTNKNKKTPNPSEYYNHILKESYGNSRSLKEIYYDSFTEKIKEYFLSRDVITKIMNKVTLPTEAKNINITHPFISKLDINISNIIQLKKPIIQLYDIDLFKNIKFDLFQSLYLLLDRKNIDDIEKFIENIKHKVILLLFNLYSIKLNIYKSYIEKINNIFNIVVNNKLEKKNNSIETNNELSKNINKIETKNDKIFKNNKTEKNILKLNKISKNINSIDNINSKIKKKQIEINSLKDDNGIKNYDEKILLLESELKKLIISKYTKQTKVKKNV
jgi:hypothetical protein